MIGRNFGFFGAPVMGFGFGAPSFNIDFGPRHHGYCGNPFAAAFMGGTIGGLVGGLTAASLGNGNGSYVSYPGVGPSVWANSYPTYQTAPSFPSFNFDYEMGCTNTALGGLFGDFMRRFGIQGNPNSFSTSTLPLAPFSNLTQSGRMPFPLTPTLSLNNQGQTSGSQSTAAASTQGSSAAGQQQATTQQTTTVNSGGATVVEQTTSTTATGDQSASGTTAATDTEPANTILIYGDASKSTALNEAPVLESATRKGLNNEVQRYQQIMNGLNQTSKPSLENVDPRLHNEVAQYQQMALSAMNEGNIDSANESLNSLSYAVKKYQDVYPAQEPQKDAATIQADEAAFSAKCTDGATCLDKKDTKRGYYRTFEAPESTLAVIPKDYIYEKEGEYRMNKDALPHFIDLCQAAKDDGELIEVKSAFRNAKAQAREVEVEGENIAAPPGYSEHATGFALDIKNFTADNEGYSKEYKWLEKNAKYFGFEISYPYKNEQNVTAEPWHIRFNQKLLDKYGGKFKPKFEPNNAEYSKEIPGLTVEEAARIPKTVEEVTAIETQIKDILARPITTSNRQALKQQYDELNDLYEKYSLSPATEKLTKLVPKSIGKNAKGKDVTVNTLESAEIEDKAFRRLNKLIGLTHSRD